MLVFSFGEKSPGFDVCVGINLEVRRKRAAKLAARNLVALITHCVRLRPLENGNRRLLHGRALGHHCLRVRKRQRFALALFLRPAPVESRALRKTCHPRRVQALGRNLLRNRRPKSLYAADHKNEKRKTDQNAHNGKKTPQLWRSDCVERKAEIFAKILPHRNHFSSPPATLQSDPASKRASPDKFQKTIPRPSKAPARSKLHTAASKSAPGLPHAQSQLLPVEESLRLRPPASPASMIPPGIASQSARGALPAICAIRFLASAPSRSPA